MAIQSESFERQPAETTLACNPNQFGLSDLFALVTLASMLLALIVPVARAAFDGQSASAVIFFIIECGLVAVFGFWVVKRRNYSTQLGGAKLGSGFCGVVRWRYWPKLVSWTCMVLIASFQLAFSLMIARFPLVLLNVQLLICLCQLAYFTSRSFLCFWSRVYPNSIEFFEHGIVLYGTWFLPWNQITVRPSTLYPDRIVVVYQMVPNRPSGNHCVVQVTEQLRRSIFAAVDAK